MQKKLTEYFMNPAIVDYVCITQVIGNLVQENKQKMSSADYNVPFKFTREIKTALVTKDDENRAVTPEISRLIAATCALIDNVA